jgi:hypothetical protein
MKNRMKLDSFIAAIIGHAKAKILLSAVVNRQQSKRQVYMRTA